ncbi:tyrosine-type recombinase/integrase [Nocardioides sp. URHA0032]|uniref:tyrosine-type recombinase/integrase n=1 Tax=Nocardioides sp. URHA0032 TaxID=1380388 RepID=UPI0012DC4D32|nr:site-specific integrase [Nocardioides sp. URHA0032]
MAARMTKRPDGRYAVKVTTPDGPKFAYGKTQAQARTKAKEMQDRLNVGAPVRDSTRSLGEWLDEWTLTFLKASNRSRKYKSEQARYVRVWLKPHLGSVPLSRLNVADVTRLMLAMEKAGNQAESRNCCLKALRAALDDAVTNRLLAVNVAREMKSPKVPMKKARAMRPEQVGALLTAAEGLRYAPILRLLLATGMRKGEVCALRWADVDLDRREAQVNGSADRVDGLLAVSGAKTVESLRTVSLGDAGTALLRSQKAAQAVERLAAGTQWTDSGFVFTTKFGGPVEPRSAVNRTVEIARGKVGLEWVHPHTLRHTYATIALQNKVPLHVVSENLGHDDPAFTARIYAHVTQEAAQEAADTVSAVLGL